MMEDKLAGELLRFVQENRLIPPGATVTCAVSGGADSMAMLSLLFSLRDVLGISLRCAHYNHGLRAVSREEEGYVRDFCSANAIPFFVAHGDVKSNALPGESLELAARRLRYAFLQSVAGDGLLATAHTADDNLETLLLRLTRGTSLRGLGGIPMQEGKRIRPVLFATKNQLVYYLLCRGIPYRQDESNGGDFCPRNRIRHHIAPVLTKENPNIGAACVALSQQLRQEDAYLSGLALRAKQDCQVPNGYSCNALMQLDPVLRRRALFSILQEAGISVPTMGHYRLLASLLESEKPSASGVFPEGVRMERQYDVLTVNPNRMSLPEAMALPCPGTLSWGGYRISCQEGTEGCLFEKRLVDLESLTVRPRQVGDIIHLKGGSRTLKRLMIDKKIPALLRDMIPVVADRHGILAVGTLGADVTRQAAPGQCAIAIKIEREV